MASITLDGLETAIAETDSMINNMVKEKYVQEGEQTFTDVIDRICGIAQTKGKALGYKDDQLADVITMLKGGYFLPAGSILAGLTNNANKKSSLSNCYVMKMENDSIESIFKILGEMARTYSYRGGCGVDITVLRPQGTIVHNAAKTSSGAVSFMPLFSSVTETIGQNGRRGAMMITMDVRHPDIMRYVWCKADPARVFQNDFLNKNSSQKKILPLITALRTLVDESKPTNQNNLNLFIDRISEECYRGKLPSIDGANISVKFTDAFMEAVRKDEPWECVFPDIEADKELYNTQWDGDYDHWEKVGGKLCKTDTYLAYVTQDNECNFKGHQLQFVDDGEFITIQNSAQLADLVKEHNKGVYPCCVVAKIPSARQIFMDACTAAWYRGDPGALFWDQVKGWTTINQNDPKLRLCCTNPCSEIPSYAGGSCLLGAHVISKYVTNPWTTKASFDSDLWMQNCNAATVLMNIFSDLNETMHPLQQQRDLEHYAKRIGIEFTGLADTLSMLGLKYGNHADTIEFIEGIMRSKAMIEIGTSLELAKQFTVCDYFKQHPNAVEELLSSDYIQHLYGEDHPMYAAIREVGGLRNVAFNTVGPTGSLSILANNCSSGIEPVFSMFYTRRTRVGDKQEYVACHTPVARHLVEVIKAGKVDRRKLTKKFVKTMYNVVEAHELGFEDRIAIQQACQKYCDSSISSTVNLSSDCKPEDIMKIYLYAYEQKLKGITIYRDGSLTGVLSALPDTEETSNEQSESVVLEKDPSPADLQSSDGTSTVEEVAATASDMLDDMKTWVAQFEPTMTIQHGQSIMFDHLDAVGADGLQQSFVRFVFSNPKIGETPIIANTREFHSYTVVELNPELVNCCGDYAFDLDSYDQNVAITLCMHIRNKQITLITEAKTKDTPKVVLPVAETEATQIKVADEVIERAKDERFTGSLFINFDEEVYFESVGQYAELHAPFVALVNRNPIVTTRRGSLGNLFTDVRTEGTATLCSINTNLKNLRYEPQKPKFQFQMDGGKRHFVVDVSVPTDRGLNLTITEIAVMEITPEMRSLFDCKDEPKLENTSSIQSIFPETFESKLVKTTNNSESTMEDVLKWGEVIEMPKKTLAERHEVYWNGSKMYIVVSMNEKNRPMEIFISSLPRKVSTANDIFDEADYQGKLSLWTALMRMISVSLRAGVDVSIITNQLRKAAFTVNDMMSVIARVLETYTKDGQTETSSAWGDEDPEEDLPVATQCSACPQCGEKALRHEGGCATCHSCGYSKCS